MAIGQGVTTAASGGISGLVRRLVRAPRRQRRIALAVMALGACGGAAVAHVLDGNEAAGAAAGLIASLLPVYLVLVRAAALVKSYSLFVPGGARLATGLRAHEAITIAPLVEKLSALGYCVEVWRTDSDARRTAAASPETPLQGPSLELRHAHARAGSGGIALQLGGDGGPGSLDVTDTPRGLYAEMALYTIVALGEVLRGTEFKETFSSLSAESTEWLRPQPPDRPRAL